MEAMGRSAMNAPEAEVLTSRGEKLEDLRKAARIWAGWEPVEIVEAEAHSEWEPETCH